MFICSVRMSTLKFALAVCLCLAVLIGIFVMAGDDRAVAESGVTYESVKGDAARREFLTSFGWQLSGEAAVEEEIKLPRSFDRVLVGYNEIQRAQGLDLSAYCGKTVMCYTYVVSNYGGADGKVYAHLLMLGDRVIGGDIASAKSGGFLHGFEQKNAMEQGK